MKHWLCLVLYLTGCVNSYNGSNPDSYSTIVHVKSGNQIIAIDESRYTIAKYDGCLYLIARADNSITHIGSCPNPIHMLRYCDTLIVHDTIVVKQKM